MKNQSYGVLERHYVDACNRIAQMFCEKYELNFESDAWTGHDVGGALIVGDYVINLDDMRLMLRDDVAFNIFLQWYDYCLDCHYVEVSPVNLRTWVLSIDLNAQRKESLRILVDAKKELEKMTEEFKEKQEKNPF